MLCKSEGVVMRHPIFGITRQILAMRIRENKWDALDRALNDLFLDLEHEVNMPMLLDAIQASLTARMGLIDDCSNEHSNLQQDVDIFNAIAPHMERNYQHNGLITRAEKLEQLEIAISKLQEVTT